MTPGRSIRLRREAWGFAVGSSLFALGAVPWYADAVGLVATNATFAAGAVFFTLAAFIQLALSGRRPPRRESTRADHADWWAAAVQFAGTLLFNLSTITALLVALRPTLPSEGGWRPDAWGSICFLVASSFAVVATTDRERPRRCPTGRTRVASAPAGTHDEETPSSPIRRSRVRDLRHHSRIAR